MGCQSPLKVDESSLPQCNTEEQIRVMRNLTRRYTTFNEQELYEATGCLADCTRATYAMKLISSSRSSSSSNSSDKTLTLQLYYQSGQFMEMEQVCLAMYCNT